MQGMISFGNIVSGTLGAFIGHISGGKVGSILLSIRGPYWMVLSGLFGSMTGAVGGSWMGKKILPWNSGKEWR